MRTKILVVVGGGILALSTAGAEAATFTITGPAASPSGFRGDAILSSIHYGEVSFDASALIYPSAVSELDYTGGIGQFRIVSAPEASTNSPDPTINVTGFHPIEAQDGNPSSVSDTDRQLLADRIAASFQNRNLNNYLDLISSSESFSFTLHFDTPLRDNDSGDDGIGELLYFERGWGGSNSYVLMAVDEAGNTIGRTVVATPILIGPQQADYTPQTLSPEQGPTYVAIYDEAGREIGSQEMQGLALDLSSTFGVTEISALRISIPDLSWGISLGHLYDLAPDIKILGLDTRAAGGDLVDTPEPALAAPLALVGWILGRRRKSGR